MEKNCKKMEDNLIRFYTELIFVSHMPRKADVIFVPGSETAALGEQAAKLWKDGFAPVILVSGKYSIMGQGFTPLSAETVNYPGTYETEADFLGTVMENNGVPSGAVWKEKTATFTYENAIASRRMTETRQLTVKRAILCCKPSHARRCLLYYQLLFPETEFLVCPCSHEITADNWYTTEKGIDTVLGEAERLGTQFHQILRKHCLEKKG